MNETDPLIRLLQGADAASDLPSSVGDLPNRVRQRRSARVAKVKRIKLGTLAGVVVVLAAVALNFREPPAPPGVSGLGSLGVARLRADAEALDAEANALAHEIALTRGHELRQQLRDEHQSQLAAQLERQSSPDSIDRAALVGLSQGDFYRDVRQSTDNARAAYESVIDHFPDSRWAALAQGRINELQMN